MRSPARFPGALSLCAVALSAALTAGCATAPPDSGQTPLTEAPSGPIEIPGPAAIALASEERVPVTRYGRYTLVELVPSAAQRDLMRQVVDITMPSTFDATVGDALGYVLLRSGYRMCDSAETSALYALPLAAAHLHLGPVMLRDALQTLAGSAWDLSLDEESRQVCFSRHKSAAPSGPSVRLTPSAALPADIRSDPAPLDGLRAWEMQP